MNDLISLAERAPASRHCCSAISLVIWRGWSSGQQNKRHRNEVCLWASSRCDARARATATGGTSAATATEVATVTDKTAATAPADNMVRINGKGYMLIE